MPETPETQTPLNAESGNVSSRGLRLYGYVEEHITVIEQETEIIREATHQLQTIRPSRQIVADAVWPAIIIPSAPTDYEPC
ncbi:hypothetical protein [Nonomuraea sediminis]|uniref:hypothetical protein n=1 Tax=Nonomuraea sediminis TaxID=2835864 RepID=UPI001BDD94DC|nr:hypothetical protein [Nonomuraea sediminis]